MQNDYSISTLISNTPHKNTTFTDKHAIGRISLTTSDDALTHKQSQKKRPRICAAACNFYGKNVIMEG